MDDTLLTITEAAAFLGVSVDTLRRWDKSGKLFAVRKEGGTHRFYTQRSLELVKSDIFALASEWAFSGVPVSSDWLCSNSGVFQARLTRMQDEIMRSEKIKDFFSLVVAVAGEIGNNSFDHNLGNWPDISGIFFGYDVNKGEVILADRGLGVLHTLQRVRPDLKNHQAALHVAFTEVVSGRAPEERGNGLKFVRSVVGQHPIGLFFQTGDAELRMKGNTTELHMTKGPIMIRGCLVRITF